MVDFASVDDVSTLLGRPLTDAEVPGAMVRLRRASRIIRTRWSDVDARLEASTLDAEDVADVVAAMVARSIQRPADGVQQYQQTTGPFAVSATYSNPDGNLYVTAEEARLFEPKGRPRAFSVDLTP